MAQVELCLLGAFEVRGPAGSTIAVGPRKLRALLAYLGVHHGKPVSREVLSSLIWGDVSADEQARRSLRQALTVLRRELPEGVVEAQRDSIVLGATTSVDVSRFQHDAREVERAALERALSLYRGELLEGFVAKAEGFDAWLERERRRMTTLAADAMQRLCELQRAQGDAEASMVTAMRLVATDPLREAAHRLLMELYAEAGRSSEAVRQFNALQALLAEKLGTRPDARTLDLLERLRRSSERRDAPLPQTYPIPARAAPELRHACVLAITLADQTFDASLERDVEVALARFGGTLVRVAEQSALGLFGFPRAHDNDVERAVRASLSLCRLERLDGHATIGVASGPLMVEPRRDRPRVQGDALGRAIDLSEGHAPGVVVTGAVARVFGERLEARPAERRGEARRVLGLLAAAELPPRAPLIGRDYERAQLESALELCRHSGRGRTFIVRGEAGIGKTRLLQALCESAAERGFGVHARSFVEFGDDAQERPVLGIVRELLAGEQDGSPVSIRLSSGEAALEEGDLALLLELVQEVGSELSETQQGGRAPFLRRRRDAACRLLALRSAQRARLIWVDDIQWADDETVAQIGAWMDVAATNPVLLVLTTRSQSDSDTGTLRAARQGRPVTTLDLAPLTRNEADALIAALSPADEDTAAAEVLERAGGNPLFIEQLLRSPRTIRVPPNVLSLVQARSDQLEPDDRAVVQAASALGQYFTLPALSYLVEQDQPSLTTLIDQGLIHEHADGFRFAHALVREAIYDNMPRERRTRLHATAARYYAGRDASLHAKHLDYAGEASASAAYVHAAVTERRAGDVERALELCLRGQELAERGQDRHASALLLGALLVELGRAEAALQALDSAEVSAPDATSKARAQIERAAALRLLDRSREALLALTTAERLLDPQRDAALLSRLHYLRGNVLFPLGDPAACLEAHTLALDAARRTGSAAAECYALSGIADAHYIAGRLGTARACFTRCEHLAREIGRLELELTSRGMQYVLDAYDVSFRHAVAGCQELAERARSSGALRVEALIRIVAAWSSMAIGDWEVALSEARRGVLVAESTGAQRFAALGLAYSAVARAELGQPQGIESDLQRALSLARASSLAFAGGAVYAALLATAEPERLRPLLDEADATLLSSCMNVTLTSFIQRAIEASLRLGEPERALRYADVLQESMREEPHALGRLIVDFGRALAAWEGPADIGAARANLEGVRERLAAAGLRPALAIVERALARSPGRS